MGPAGHLGQSSRPRHRPPHYGMPRPVRLPAPAGSSPLARWRCFATKNFPCGVGGEGVPCPAAGAAAAAVGAAGRKCRSWSGRRHRLRLTARPRFVHRFSAIPLAASKVARRPASSAGLAKPGWRALRERRCSSARSGWPQRTPRCVAWSCTAGRAGADENRPGRRCTSRCQAPGGRCKVPDRLRLVLLQLHSAKARAAALAGGAPAAVSFVGWTGGAANATPSSWRCSRGTLWRPQWRWLGVSAGG